MALVLIHPHPHIYQIHWSYAIVHHIHSQKLRSETAIFVSKDYFISIFEHRKRQKSIRIYFSSDLIVTRRLCTPFLTNALQSFYGLHGTSGAQPFRHSSFFSCLTWNRFLFIAIKSPIMYCMQLMVRRMVFIRELTARKHSTKPTITFGNLMGWFDFECTCTQFWRWKKKISNFWLRFFHK